MHKITLPATHFRLVGSRAVGNYTEASDWDYVGSYGDKSTLKILTDLGFTKIEGLEDSQYRDYNTQAVYKLDNIEVALVTSMKAKLQIIQALKFNPKLAAYDHSLKGTIDRVYLWNAFYTMYGLCPYDSEADNV